MVGARAERIGNLQGNRERGIDGERLAPTVLLNRLLQRRSGDEGHHDVTQPLGFADVVNRADVRVVKGGGEAGFAFKAAARGSGGGQFGQEGFDDDQPLQTQIFGLVCRGLPALPKLFDDPIVRKNLAWFEPQHACSRSPN